MTSSNQQGSSVSYQGVTQSSSEDSSLSSSKELRPTSQRRAKWSSNSSAFRRRYSGFPNYREYGINPTPWNSLRIATFSIHEQSSQRFWGLLLGSNGNDHADSENPNVFYNPEQSGVKMFLPTADLMMTNGPYYANLILVFDGRKVRLSSDDIRFIDQFKVRFGPGVCKKTCLVLLNADEMLKEQTMTEYMNNGTNETLKQLASDFDWRILGIPSDARKTCTNEFLQHELTSILNKCDEPYKPNCLAALSWRLYGAYYYSCKFCCSNCS
ncbi:hypothetical protein BSL78_12158 [Apostichopus japonicus]|uniref:AIG1-type G domain-containing protein n=1 Tax=Stichopus japonicus TaxID=307972 RepID=A0A2G8KSF1_STIJA|nr:hypothetical protein BSL78_12158 [Apostichopus japonicus]